MNLLSTVRDFVASETVTLETPLGVRHIRLYPNGQLSQFHEHEVLQDVLAEIESGDVFYDIGANFGRYTCVVGACSQNITLYAVEPHPDNVEILSQNIDLNRVDAVVIQSAIGKESETVAMNIDTHPAKHQLASGDSNPQDSIEVPVNTGDAIVQEGNRTPPDVLKIDVEGAEYDVLDGWRTTLSDGNCRAIYIELHPFGIENFGATENQVISLLSELGYQTKTLLARSVAGPDDQAERKQEIIKATSRNQ